MVQFSGAAPDSISSSRKEPLFSHALLLLWPWVFLLLQNTSGTRIAFIISVCQLCQALALYWVYMSRNSSKFSGSAVNSCSWTRCKWTKKCVARVKEDGRRKGAGLVRYELKAGAWKRPCKQTWYLWTEMCSLGLIEPAYILYLDPKKLNENKMDAGVAIENFVVRISWAYGWPKDATKDRWVIICFTTFFEQGSMSGPFWLPSNAGA